MQLQQGSRRSRSRISLTPLIDIVFILLLFFILESNFLRFGELVFDTPQRESAGQSSRRSLQMQVFADGRIWLDGRSFEIPTLAEHLSQAGHDSELPVFVRVHEDLPLQLLVRVLDILRDNELTRLQVLGLEN